MAVMSLLYDGVKGNFKIILGCESPIQHLGTDRIETSNEIYGGLLV